MGSKNFKSVIIASTLMGVALSGSVVTLYATDTSTAPTILKGEIKVETTVGISENEQVVNVKNKNITFAYKTDGLYMTDVGVERKLTEVEYTSFLDYLSGSIQAEIKTSYDNLISENLESDHLNLETWGEFLYLYADKTISSMPTGDYSFKFKENNNVITLKGDRATRQWVSSQLLPSIKESIVEVSNSFIITVNKYAPLSTTYLSDLTFDTLINGGFLSEDYKVHPFKGRLKEGDETEISLSVHSIGEVYGVQLHREFVGVVNNLEKDNGVFVSLDYNYSSCVPKIVNLGVVANSEEDTILNPKELDYLSIDDLGIDLSDGSIVKINSIDGNSFEKLGKLEDYGLSADTVAIKKLSDGVVAVPLMYKEYFQTSDKIFPNGFTVDLTPVIFSDSFDVKIGDSLTENIDRYVGVNGVVEVRYLSENKEFAILNGLGKTHYGRMCAWIWSGESDNYLSDKDKIRYLEIAEKWYKENNKKDEFKMYMQQFNGYTSKQASGKGLNPVVKVAIGGCVIAIIGIGGFVGYKALNKKNKASKTFKSSSKEFDDSDLAFGFEDDEDEE